MSTDHSTALNAALLPAVDDGSGLLGVGPGLPLGLGGSASWFPADQPSAVGLNDPAGVGLDPDPGAATSMPIVPDASGMQHVAFGGTAKPITLSLLPQNGAADGYGSSGAPATLFGGGDAILAAFAPTPAAGSTKSSMM